MLGFDLFFFFCVCVVSLFVATLYVWHLIDFHLTAMEPSASLCLLRFFFFLLLLSVSLSLFLFRYCVFHG